MAALLLREPLSSRARPLPLPPGGGFVRGLLRDCARRLRIPEDSLYVKCNGRLANDDDVLQNGVVYSVEPRLCGGKGGFGSMLRALGAQIEKTTNREACRDLSGRRLRDVNHEKAMAEWVKQQAEREAEKEQRRLERLQRKLAEPKHYFINPDYQQQCHEMAERLEDSVLKGLQATSSKVVSPGSGNSRKRPGESGKNGTKYGKKQCFLLGLEGLDDTDSSDSDNDSENDSPHASDESCPSGSGYSENAGNSNKCSNSPEDSAEHSPVTEKAPEQPDVSGGDLQREMHKDGQAEIPADENSKMTEPQKEEAQENNEVTQAVKEEVQENVSSEVQEMDQSQSTEAEPIDLFAFNSAAEMEVLGLDKLKMELMALGLKCGGTLQERAARLFSVRGLTRDQINPSLFAKPPKGKKAKV
ncbi:replication stress response regulator SDE2 [Oxyura jamaicensis]|uniref:replication stress response regulator SDE2 n=1 Tax=Oxyura jamaicensis TaxID=8884 RepID=UPI0015A6A21A|nr:replication stress response regulator SDE2 [Oxyura jamaicensis]